MPFTTRLDKVEELTLVTVPEIVVVVGELERVAVITILAPLANSESIFSFKVASGSVVGEAKI